MNNEHPGKIIKAAMKAAKLKQQAFARAVAMAPTQVSEILSGKRPMSAGFCLALEREGVGDAEIWLFMYLRYELSMLRKAAV